MAKPKKLTKKQGQKSKKSIRVKDLSVNARLAPKIKGGAIPSVGFQKTPTISS